MSALQRKKTTTFKEPEPKFGGLKRQTALTKQKGSNEVKQSFSRKSTIKSPKVGSKAGSPAADNFKIQAA